MRPRIFVRELTKEEQHSLNAGLRSSDAFVLRRSQILLACARGETAPSIAKALSCDEQTVRHAIHAFHQEGLAALQAGSSRPHQLPTVLRADVTADLFKTVLHRQPRDFGFQTSLWTLDLLVKQCVRLGWMERSVSIETMRQTLSRLGINWKRARHWITSVRRVGAYEISVKHGRGRERRPLGQELTRSRKAKVDRSMLEKRKAEEGMYSVDPQVLCA